MQPSVATPVDEWLDWLNTLHPAEIDLGLERTAHIAERMGLLQDPPPIITVAGTNGKGSVCAFAEALLLAQGHRVGLYTSPHLDRYNERVRVAGGDIDDATLLAGFSSVEAARADTPLTFFEFGTLAAMACFRACGVDVIVLETGLGGRLDATNVFAADVAVVTSIGLDHAEWLGTDRDAIAREKAGIARANHPLIMADPDPPPAWAEIVEATGAHELRHGRDYTLDADPGERDGEGHGCADTWHWSMGPHDHPRLPRPALVGGYQLANAAAALAAVTALQGTPPGRDVVEAGLTSAHVAGRFEIFHLPGMPEVEVILDVGHNPQAAATLAQGLKDRPCRGRTLALFGMYGDKDAGGVIAALDACVDVWFCATLPPPRGLSATDLASRSGLAADQRLCRCCADPVAALSCASAEAVAGDRLVIGGSFATVAQVRRHFL